MFGYVIANVDKLDVSEKQQYRSCYCGLCSTLNDRHGTISRLTLTYDMTFLVLFLTSLYNKDTFVKNERCISHPFKEHTYWRNEITEYAADMNILLTYYKFLDDWEDDKKIFSLFEAKLFEKKCKLIEERYPSKASKISQYLKELSLIEKSGELNPDIPSNCFGELMGEIFVINEDEYSERLRVFGKSLGKFIYIMDACLDLKEDIKKERYNPLVTTSSDNFSSILNILMADCTEKYKTLPIERDKNIIDNILYSGVWTRYVAATNKKGSAQI